MSQPSEAAEGGFTLPHVDLPDLTTALTLAAVVTALITANVVLRRWRRVKRLHHDLTMIVLTLVGVMVIAWSFEPGRREAAFTVLGILISAIIALSSGTLIGNGMAGVLLRVERHFRAGDFVRVGEHFGRVSERGLFFTEVQNELRDLVTLPNSYLISQPVTVIRTPSTLVCSEISLGYDVPRARVERLLLRAAEEAGLDGAFVHIRALGDFSVSYRVSGLLAESTKLLSARSALHGRVLDVLHEDGVEIVSPAFMNQRVLPQDQVFIPPAEAETARPAAGPEPEGVMFDKAKEAAARERLNDLVEAVDKKIARLETDLASAEADDRSALEGRLERLSGRRAWLTELIERQQDEDADP